jgi:thiamine biosynthesis protein ThiS
MKIRIATHAVHTKRNMKTDKRIEIIINGLKEKVPEKSTISFLIKHLNERDAHLIVEYNGRFLYPQKYDETVVGEGDQIEFINPDFGG